MSTDSLRECAVLRLLVRRVNQQTLRYCERRGLLAEPAAARTDTGALIGAGLAEP